MKKSAWISGMAFGCGLAGLVACILRWRLLRAGADEKGLLVAGQFPEIAGNVIRIRKPDVQIGMDFTQENLW